MAGAGIGGCGYGGLWWDHSAAWPCRFFHEHTCRDRSCRVEKNVKIYVAVCLHRRLFTFLRHAIILISYDDISDPNYEAYKDWDIWSFILSDVKRLIFWLAIGVLGYFAFIRGNRILRRLCILGIVLFLLLFLAMLVLGRVSSLDDSMIVAVRAISSCLSARIQLAV